MRMKLVMGVSVLILMACVNAVPQEVKHAPTLQSCVADLNLWTSQIPGWPNPSAEQAREGTKPLTVQEMNGRGLSVSNCASAYPALYRGKSNELSPALSLTTLYDGEIQERLMNFLDRHNLLGKFTLEDESGKR